MSNTIEETDIDLESLLTPDYINTHKHIINPPLNKHIFEPWMSSQDVLSVALKKGLPVYTLCGKEFVPQGDGASLPMCEPCMDIANELVKQYG